MVLQKLPEPVNSLFLPDSFSFGDVQHNVVDRHLKTVVGYMCAN
jgi:hypothetical protein